MAAARADTAATWRARLHRLVLAWTKPRVPEELPVRLDRRRVYVLPTRFGLFFGGLLLAMTLGALNYNNNPALLLALMLTGAALASLVAAQLQLTGLDVVAVEAEPVPAGSPLLLRIHASATDSRRRRGLRVAAEATAQRSSPLSLEHGFGESELEWPTQVRGWLQPPRLRLSTTRPLGLARAWVYVWSRAPLLVYPAPEPQGPPLPSGSGDRQPSRVHPTGDDVHHLRAYRSGDARRAIAWKPSARRDHLLVREYEHPAGTEVLLEWRMLEPLSGEQRISRLARWIDDAEREGRRYRLVLPGQLPLGPAHGPAHRHACLRALALLPHG